MDHDEVQTFCSGGRGISEMRMKCDNMWGRVSSVD